MEATLPLQSFLKGNVGDYDNLDTLRGGEQSPPYLYSPRKSSGNQSFDLSLPSPSTRHRISAMRSSMTSFSHFDNPLKIPKIVKASHNLSISLPTSPRLHTAKTNRENQVTYFKNRPVALNLLLDNYPPSKRLF